jgi:hypothetical protein
MKDRGERAILSFGFWILNEGSGRLLVEWDSWLVG